MTTEAKTKQWYIIHTYSGFEKKVKESLEGRVAAFGLADKIGQIVHPLPLQRRAGAQAVDDGRERCRFIKQLGMAGHARVG